MSSIADDLSYPTCRPLLPGDDELKRAGVRRQGGAVLPVGQDGNAIRKRRIQFRDT